MTANLNAFCDRGIIQAVPHSSSPPTDSRMVLATTIVASSLAFIDGSVINVGLPAIATSLSTGGGGLSWVVNGYLLPLSALLLIGGAAGDVFGRRSDRTKTECSAILCSPFARVKGVEHDGSRRWAGRGGGRIAGRSGGARPPGRARRACRRHWNSRADAHVRLAGHQGRRRRLSGGADRPHHHPLHARRRRRRRLPRRCAGYGQYRRASPRLRQASHRRDRLFRRRGLRRGSCNRRDDRPQGRGRAQRRPRRPRSGDRRGHQRPRREAAERNLSPPEMAA